MSAAMVFFGGLIAGYLAQSRHTEETNVGFRAGIIGGLPVLWIAYNFVSAGFAPEMSLTSSVFGLVAAVAFILGSLLISAVIGILGAKVGRWWAGKNDSHQTTTG